MSQGFNVRVLVVDDEEVVRDSFREILTPRPVGAANELAQAAADLFGDEAPAANRSSTLFEFEVDEAASGEDALARVAAARASGRPYALVFLDMRMPGWGGLETARRVRGVDDQAELVFVTAYSDHGIEEVIEQAGANVGYHCKPFAPEEIRQIATKAVYEWNKLRSLEGLMAIAGDLRASGDDLETLLRNILDQICQRLGSRSAAMLRRDSVTGGVSSQLATGVLTEAEPLAEVMALVAAAPGDQEMVRTPKALLITLSDYTVAALLEDEGELSTEKLYLLRLFVEHAARAVENTRLQALLLEREKLSAIGTAMSQVVHDLKQPISIITGAIRLVDVAKREPERLASLHRMIGRAAEDLLDYVEDILAYARGDAAARERADLSELMTELSSRMEALYGERAAWLEWHIAPGIEAIVATKKVQRVILNLAKNAVDAVRQARIEAPRIRISLSRGPDGSATLQVEDNGPGVPTEIAATLFEPFVTFGKTRGTGLGLAIVRRIVDNHDGQVEMRTTGEGAIFTVTLPATRG